MNVNATMGWALAAAAVVVGWYGYGWPGVAMAISVTVFWLLLQMSRALRAMRNASDAPVGHLGSAVMMQTKLRPGMSMLQVVGLTRSLGRKRDELGADVWTWTDQGDVDLTLSFEKGRLVRWELQRPPGDDDIVDAAAGAAPAPRALPPAAPPAA